MAEQSKFKRVVLKLSGEAMAGEKGFGIDPLVVDSIARQIKDVTEAGLEVAVVNGGGNIWRGLSGSSKGMDRATADYMGMLATVINSLALQGALENLGVPTRVQTAIEMRQIAETYPDCRNLYQAQGYPPHGKGKGSYFCGRHRQPVFFNRYDCCAACG